MPRDGRSSYDRSLTPRVVQESLLTGKRKIVKTYDYRDEEGQLLFQTVRFDPKGFAYRQPDGKGRWLWNLKGVPRVLYRLPEILPKPTVYIVEGEKDADRLWSLGIPATTSPMGAKNWRVGYAQSLKGKRVVILPDNDAEGKRYAQDVARSLVGVATAVKVVRLPGLNEHGDVSDWLNAGGTKEELLEMVERTPWGTDDGQLQPSLDRAEGRSVMQWLTLAELRKETQAIINYVVEGLLAEKSLSVLGGKMHVGKSTLARNLARCVCRGEPFLGRQTVQGPVLYVAPEESREGVMVDLDAMGMTESDPLHFCFSSAPRDVLEQVRAKRENTGAKLVILETIFRILHVKDVNDYAETTRALNPLLALARDTGAHILFTHHLGKGEREGLDALLGSTAIGGTPDTRLLLKATATARTLTAFQRYGSPMEETILLFNPDTKIITTGGSKEQAEEDRSKQAILEFLTAQTEPVTEKDIDSGVEGKTQRKRFALRALVDEGKIQRSGKGGHADPYRYALSDLVPDVPTIYGEHGNKMPENGVTPGKDEGSSCSQGVPLFASLGTSREQDSGPLDLALSRNEGKEEEL